MENILNHDKIMCPQSPYHKDPPLIQRLDEFEPGLFRCVYCSCVFEFTLAFHWKILQFGDQEKMDPDFAPLPQVMIGPTGIYIVKGTEAEPHGAFIPWDDSADMSVLYRLALDWGLITSQTIPAGEWDVGKKHVKREGQNWKGE